jgi:hypothetical protein
MQHLAIVERQHIVADLTFEEVAGTDEAGDKGIARLIVYLAWRRYLRG